MYNNRMRMIKSCGMITVLICLALLFSGCATMVGGIVEGLKCAIGISTKEVEEARPRAIVKTFNYDYDTCHKKTLEFLKKHSDMPIYAIDKKKRMIAIFYVDFDTTPVGIFFTSIDPTHTRIEVSSQSSSAKELVANPLFEKLSK